MKRLNPQTGKPFKHNDVREDGYIFFNYKKSTIDSNGFFGENWLKPELFERERQRYCTPVGRAQKLLAKARYRGGNVTISQEWVVKKIEAGYCELTGIEFDLNRNDFGFDRNPFAPSLDRIDNTKHEYSEENTRVVLLCVNLALNQFGLEILKPVFKKLADCV